MRKIKLFLSLLMLIAFSVGNVWAVDVTCTLSNANIVAAGDAGTSYASHNLTDGCSQTWHAYAIKNKHSNATSDYHFLQIKKYASGTAYYVQVPEKSGYTIKSITMVVSGTSAARGNGGNSATLYFSASNSTSAGGTGVASGTGASSVTIDCSSLELATGYITAGGAVRIWGDVVVTYTPVSSSCDKKVNISAGTTSNGTFDLSKTGEAATCDAAVEVVVTPHPEEHFEVDEVTASNGGSVSGPNGEGKYTVTYAKDYNNSSVINVTFKQKAQYTVTWNVNGETSTSQVYKDEKPVFPATPAACDATSTTFIGWATEPWTGKIANLDDKTVYTSASAMPAVTGNGTIYYAVFAKSSGSASNLFEWAGGSSADLTAEGNHVTAQGLGSDYAAGNSPYLVKLDGTGDNIIIDTEAAIGSVEIGVKMIGGANTSSITVQEADSKDAELFTDVETLSISGAQNDVVNLATTNAFASTSRAVKLLFTKGSNVGLGPITIVGAVSMSDYMTTCAAPTCENLETPVVNVTNKTYNSARLTWAAVTNAAKYLVKFNGEDQEATDNLYFDAASLDAETQYTYQVKALAEANQDDWCDGAFSEEANFTTDAAPTAHLTLIDIEGTHASSGDYAVGTPFNLPTTAATCSKTFVGWDPDDECATEPTYAKGAPFTFADQTGVTLYAVYATAANVTAEFNAGEYAAANSWEDATAYSGFTINGVTFTANGGGNNGKYYTSDNTWRLYNGGSVSLSATGNISSVSSTPSLTFTIDGTSASCSFTATTKIKSISVTYEGAYSNYSTTCVEQLAEPTFTLDEGEYATTDKTVKIQATNEAAIYYSLDGTTPAIDAEHLYDGNAIALNARGAYNFKAIAVKAGFENSDVAEAEYKINPPFESVADLFSYVGNNTTYNLGQVTVTGYVSEIVTEYSSQHDNVSYNISDDGKTTSAQLQSYRGKGVKTGEETYEDADLVAVGDKVTIIGTYKVFGSSNTKELDAGNYIITRVAKGNIASLAVSGTADKTEYSNGEDFLFGGLVATASYESGYAAEVTPDSWAADPATVTATGTVAVTATVGSVTSPAYNVNVTVSAKTLVSIAVGTASYNIYTGQALPQPTVTATYSEGEPEDVSASAEYDTESVFDTNTPDEYTITVSYTFGGETKTATYTVTVADYANDAAHPYTPAQARDLTINVIGSTKSTKNIYVQGIVSRANAVTGSNKRQRYWISIDGETTSTEFEVYNGLYLNGADFSTSNQLVVGDEVIVFGKVIYYNSTTPEFATGESQLYSLARTPEFTIENVVSFEVGANDLAEGNLDITTPSEGEITFVSGDDTKATIVANAIHAVAPGTVTITANMAADGIYKAASTTFSVTVIAATDKYAITFDGNGNTGGSAPEAITDKAAGANVTLPANTYTKTGYTFAGWKVYDENEVEVTVTAGAFEMPASDVTIKAQWEAISEWAYVYTSTLKMSGATASTVIIGEDSYYAMKAGTGSAAGSINVAVPAGATKIHFHASGWDQRSVTLNITAPDGITVTPASVNLVADAGVSGNTSTYTLENDPATTAYFAVTLSGNTDAFTLTFANTGSKKQFVLFGVNQEGGNFGSYQRTVTENNYGTICLPYAGTISGATLLDIAYFDGAMIYCDEVNGVALKAGKPYIFYATSNSLNVAYTANIETAAGEANGLHGFYNLSNMATDAADKKDLDQDDGNYILYQNQYWLVSGRAAYINNFRAYIKLDEISTTAPDPTPGQAPRRRVAMSVHGEQVATGIDALNASDAPVKVLINGQLFIIRGEKMYDAKGQLVK